MLYHSTQGWHLTSHPCMPCAAQGPEDGMPPLPRHVHLANSQHPVVSDPAAYAHLQTGSRSVRDGGMEAE